MKCGNMAREEFCNMLPPDAFVSSPFYTKLFLVDLLYQVYNEIDKPPADPDDIVAFDHGVCLVIAME